MFRIGGLAESHAGAIKKEAGRPGIFRNKFDVISYDLGGCCRLRPRVFSLELRKRQQTKASRISCGALVTSAFASSPGFATLPDAQFFRVLLAASVWNSGDLFTLGLRLQRVDILNHLAHDEKAWGVEGKGSSWTK